MSVSHVATKPPISRVNISHGATEILVNSIVVAKVIFTWNSSSVGFEGTAAGHWAVGVEDVAVPLPELCCGTTPCCMSTNIDVIHRFALTATKKAHDVKVAELASEVIPVINLLFHDVKAAGCSPVCGSAAEAFHSSHSLTVDVPVWGVVVDWCVLHKRLASKLRQIFIFQVPGHDYGPGRSRLGWEITVCHVSLILIIKKPVEAVLELAMLQVVQTGSGLDVI